MNELIGYIKLNAYGKPMYDIKGVDFTVVSDNSVTCYFGSAPVGDHDAHRWLTGYREKGWKFLEDIEKPVIAIICNDHTKEILVAVDKYRICSLYWLIKDNTLYFTSTIQALLIAANEPFSVDPNALYSYLDLLCIPSDLSIQKGVKKLSGGTCLRVSGGSVEIMRYHDFKYIDKLVGEEQELAGGIRSRLETSVRDRLDWVSDEKVGCFLSGGTDSSSLLGCCFLANGSGFPAYSVTFSEDSWDELEYAEVAAKTFSARHTEVHFVMEDVWRIADKLAEECDEPMGNPSLLATCKCVEAAAADGIKYLIAGDGGDEIFGGNERYATDAVYSKFHDVTPRYIRAALRDTAKLASSISDNNALKRLHRILKRAHYPNPQRYYLDDAFAFKVFPDAFIKDFAERVNPEVALDIFTNYYRSAQANNDIDRLLYIDMRHTLGDNDLVKVRISGKANDVGILYPMLDDDLVEYACRLPTWAKLKAKEKRYLFKIAMRGLVPEKILYKRKQGFGVPISHWLRSSEVFHNRLKEVILDRAGLVRGVTKESFLVKTLKEHQSGNADNGMFLWGLYSLNLWANVANRWGR